MKEHVKKIFFFVIFSVIFLNVIPASAAEIIKDTKEYPPDYLSRLVKSGNDKFHVTLSGHVNQAVLYSNDGIQNNVFYGNNPSSTTRLKIIGKAKVDDDTQIITKLIFGFKNDELDTVSQKNPTPGRPVDIRQANVTFASKHYGDLSIGQGDTASNGTAEVDLSGTGMAMGSPVMYAGGGLFFRNKATSAFSTNNVGKTFNNLDGLSRKGRVRYDTPHLNGVGLAGSVSADDTYDAALRVKHSTDQAKFAGAVAYTDTHAVSSTVRGNAVDGSASVLFENGFNATGAAGYINADAAGRKDPHYHYVKVGYQADLVPAGITAFAGDFSQFHHYIQNGDKGQAWGAVVVQHLKDWHTELYAGYRYLKLFRSGSSFHPIHVVLAGARAKF